MRLEYLRLGGMKDMLLTLGAFEAFWLLGSGKRLDEDLSLLVGGEKSPLVLLRTVVPHSLVMGPMTCPVEVFSGEALARLGGDGCCFSHSVTNRGWSE